MECTALYTPWVMAPHISKGCCTSMYGPWVMGNPFPMTHAVYSAVHSMGHGWCTAMYGPWVMGKKSLNRLSPDPSQDRKPISETSARVKTDLLEETHTLVFRDLRVSSVDAIQSWWSPNWSWTNWFNWDQSSWTNTNSLRLKESIFTSKSTT